jgi:shikimate kinase
MNFSKLFLIGPMGAGKTTVGRYLARILGLPFVDTDIEIEKRCGTDIPWIFDVEGESGFREREHKVLVDVCSMPPCVVATGGGIVMREDNRKLLIEEGVGIYLQASVTQQVGRVSNDKSRPLIQNGNPEVTLEKLMLLRDPLYRTVAKFSFATDIGRPKFTANKIAKKIQELEVNFK